MIVLLAACLGPQEPVFTGIADFPPLPAPPACDFDRWWEPEQADWQDSAPYPGGAARIGRTRVEAPGRTWRPPGRGMALDVHEDWIWAALGDGGLARLSRDGTIDQWPDGDIVDVLIVEGRVWAADRRGALVVRSLDGESLASTRIDGGPKRLLPAGDGVAVVAGTGPAWAYRLADTIERVPERDVADPPPLERPDGQLLRDVVAVPAGIAVGTAHGTAGRILTVGLDGSTLAVEELPGGVHQLLVRPEGTWAATTAGIVVAGQVVLPDETYALAPFAGGVAALTRTRGVVLLRDGGLAELAQLDAAALPMSLVASADRLFVGTGFRGLLVELDGDGVVAEHAVHGPVGLVHDGFWPARSDDATDLPLAVRAETHVVRWNGQRFLAADDVLRDDGRCALPGAARRLLALPDRLVVMTEDALFAVY